MLIIFLFLLGNCHQSLSILVTDFQSYQSFSTDSTQTVSKAISDVIREFFIATDIQFNFIIYNETSKHINDIIDETQKQLSQYLSSIKIKHFTNITKRIHDLDKSVVIFIKTITAFEYFQVSRHNAVEKVKYLIYIEEIKNFQLLSEKIKINRPPEFDIRSPVNFRYFEFFIIANKSSINIIANVLYSETKCEIFEPKILNSFDSKMQKWKQNLNNIELFGNFHGCMLKFIAPMDHLFYINENEQSFYGPQVKITDKIHLASTDADSYDLFYENAKLQGLTYEIIQTMAQKYNFTPHYNLYKDRGLSPTRNFFTKSLRTNFLMTTILDLRYIRKKFHLSQPLGTQDFFCLVSLNDFYTNYDKMLLPFDSATWMLILCTYGLTFGIIFGLRFSPEWIRITVIGKGIKGPGYNALAIFMGISQLKLPTETFCRSILIIYIWFCLMIRTCWQSKMFEFMTSDMRKPLPKSFEDLKEMNYTFIFDESYLYVLDDYFHRKEKPIMMVVDTFEFYNLYQSSLEEKTNLKYAFYMSNELYMFLKSRFKTSLPILENEGATKTFSYIIQKNSIIGSQINEIIDRLIEAGIAKQVYEHGLWYNYRPIDDEIEDSRRILSMSDLEFGFVIFLGVLSMSIMVFICEVSYIFLRKQFIEFLGLCEILRAIYISVGEYSNRPVQATAKAIYDVIHEFYIVNGIKFDFIILGKTTNHINDVTNGIINKTNKNNFPIKLKVINDISSSFNLMTHVVLFMETVETLIDWQHKSENEDFRERTEIEKKRILIYIEEIIPLEYLDQLQMKIKDHRSEHSQMDELFFIVNDINSINLGATVFYSELKCELYHLKSLNTFDLQTQKWTEKFKNFDQAENFHGCMVNFVVTENNKELNHQIVESIAQKCNFTPHFNIFMTNRGGQNGVTEKLSNPIFLGITSHDSSQSLYPIGTHNFYFLISRNGFYSNYEKLLFPFDTTTWFLILLTFGLTVLFIIILDLSPEWLRTTFVGKGIKGPGYNAIAIFMGISQLKLPTETFCRNILLVYIWFCLIIRTCWQSKMFEFMTSDMRKPLPASLEDLIEMNYAIILRDEEKFPLYHIIDDKIRPNMLFLDNHEFLILYSQAIFETSSVKYAFFVSDEINLALTTVYRTSLPIMENEKITRTLSYKMFGNDVLSVHFNDMISKFIESGITRSLYDFELWYNYRPSDKEIKDTRRILSMSDLEFGFMIFAGFLLLAFAVFMCEINSLLCRRHFRKFVGLYEFLRLIRARSRDYHDKW